jgi:hypothetical protein
MAKGYGGQYLIYPTFVQWLANYGLSAYILAPRVLYCRSEATPALGCVVKRVPLRDPNYLTVLETSPVDLFQAT